MSTLNEKILSFVKTIECDTSIGGTSFIVYPQGVANSIEQLILQGKVDLSNQIKSLYVLNKARDFQSKADKLHNELTEQIKT